jgi:hypothetical protein
VIIASYNDHCPAPFYPSLHGWFGTTKLTRVWEPALLWNQFHSVESCALIVWNQ